MQLILGPSCWMRRYSRSGKKKQHLGIRAKFYLELTEKQN
jgi:hypothetical protein